TPNPFAADWVEDKYADLLSALSEKVFGRRLRLSVKHDGGAKLSQQLPLPMRLESPPPPTIQRVQQRSAHAGPGNGSPSTTDAPLNERYTFDRFVVGNNNQFAAATAHAVAEAPARMYNPLFLYGGVGLGKTHLMHAIGHAVAARSPERRVVYISSERFTNELVSAIQEGTMAEFRRIYRQIDLLLVDDIQFLEGKERTQEEFFHTFNTLHDAQR